MAAIWRRGAPTPGIKRLAAEGMKLLNVRSRRSARRPRSALLTGRHAIRSGTHAVRIVAVRALALDWGWEALLATEPAGVYQHPHGRPLLVRKLAGKSLRELVSPSRRIQGT